MPLFSRHSNAAEQSEAAPVTPESKTTETSRRRSSLFGRRRSTSPPVNTTSASRENPERRRGFLHRDNEDPSIVGARERVFSAETAEREADRALMTARAAVKEAREHVKRLEREAAEEARLAKIKQQQAHSISKRGKLLGRHNIE